MNPMEYGLKVVESAYSQEIGAEFPLSAAETVIGRADDCGVRLADVLVSRYHAAIVAGEEGPVLEDKGSANGVWMDDEQVSKCPLRPGQRFRVGTTILELISMSAGGAGEVAEARTQVRPAGARKAVTPAGTTLLEEGEPLKASGNNPVLLDDPGSVWFVEQGKVEIFTVGVKDGKPIGPRSHYLTVEPGGLFFGMDLESYGLGYGFLAVGKAGTILRRVAVSQLEGLVLGGCYVEEIAGLVEQWVRGLSRSLTKEIIPGPVSDINLAVEQKVSMEKGQKASTSKSVLWLDVERGELLYIGMENLKLSARELFPVTPDTWVEASNEFGVHTDLAAVTTGEAVSQPALWRGLHLFHEILCKCEFINKRLAVVDEFQRLKTKAEYSKAARNAAVKSLASVLQKELSDVDAAPTDEDPDPTFRAMSIVGEAQGIQIKTHPSLKRDWQYDDRVGVIARASSIRTRKIVMRGDWWTLDQGPILARLEEGEIPVALVPTSSSSYDVVDPNTGSREAVTEAVAE